jgi:hypothetical protein
MLADRLKGDYFTMCANRADRLGQELAHRLAVYGAGDSEPPSPAFAAVTAHQQRAETDDIRRRQEAWIARAKVAAKGLFLIREEDAMDATFMMDKEITGLRRACLTAGLVTDHL